MTTPIHPSGSSYSLPQTQSPQERKKLFELQFETAVLGIFVAVTGQNNSPIQRQISQLKNGIAAAQPPDQLATSLNQLISQINTTIVPGMAKFPQFQFSGEGSQVQATTYQAITLEKGLLILSEKGHLDPRKEQKLFEQLSSLIGSIAQMTSDQAYSHLNQIIDQANSALPSAYQIPHLSP